jgi:hypothetical protein
MKSICKSAVPISILRDGPAYLAKIPFSMTAVFEKEL